MKIIYHQHIETNRWLHLDDDVVLADAAVSLSLRRWLRDRNILKEHTKPLAVRLEPDDDPATLADDLQTLAMVAIVFPNFSEGRGYTQARRLRQHHGYEGEIRALNAHRDHLQFMSRVGINTFELAPGEDLDAALAILLRSRVYYQNDRLRGLEGPLLHSANINSIIHHLPGINS